MDKKVSAYKKFGLNFGANLDFYFIRKKNLRTSKYGTNYKLAKPSCEDITIREATYYNVRPAFFFKSNKWLNLNIFSEIEAPISKKMNLALGYGLYHQKIVAENGWRNTDNKLEENKTPIISEQKPVCNAPYFEYKENECCLDSNNNKICDINEVAPKLSPVVQPDTTSFFYEIDNKPAGALSCSSTSISINKACIHSFNSTNPSVILDFDNTGKTTITNLKVRVLCQTSGTKDMAFKLTISMVDLSSGSGEITVDLVNNKCVGNAKRLEIYPQLMNGWCKDKAIILTPPQEC